ncbi:BrnA antitoxin family protein [Brachymonas sp. G13]|uniref:BrnA antitoxin family protein n=1 Tax=Brachymonas wangyanguii TaxID=3130163 RepID=UPI00307DA473
MNAKGKKIPVLRSDEEAERFVDSADLSEYDLSEFKPMRFELAKKEASLDMRLPSSLMNAIRAKAEALGIPYSRYVRMVLEADVQRGR